MRTILAFSILLGLASCVTVTPTREPVAMQWILRSNDAPKNSRLVVLLPGRHSRGSDFVRKGFIDEMRHLSSTDFLAVDLHFGYYKNKSLITRLHQDVVLPARRKGYREIHLAGISMGGMGALFYAGEFGNEIDGLILLSPFVGGDRVLEEIEAAGGLADWKPVELAENDFERKLWDGIRELLPQKRPTGKPRIWLACGHRDQLLASNTFFANELLSPRSDQFRKTQGAHDWKSWKAMMSEFQFARDIY